MNLLSAVWHKVTYRTEHSDPDSAIGLQILPGRWGGRTVRDPRLPGYLDARRIRLLREGFDPVDRALLDAATIGRLQTTAADLRGPRVAVNV